MLHDSVQCVALSCSKEASQIFSSNTEEETQFTILYVRSPTTTQISKSIRKSVWHFLLQNHHEDARCNNDVIISLLQTKGGCCK